MPDAMLKDVIERAAAVHLLYHVTLVGGEPFIKPRRLLRVLRQLLNGYGVWDLFIPTNGRWVLASSYIDIAEEMQKLAQFVPHGICVAFSENPWNLEQLGTHAGKALERWRQLEERFPGLFTIRRLDEKEMKNIGRAKINEIARTSDVVGAHCDFDDWLDPGQGIGFLSDYLTFWPDGTVRTCYAGGPILGRYDDDYQRLLEKRTGYLLWLRRKRDGTFSYGNLNYKACENCEQNYEVYSTLGENASPNQ